MTRAIDPFDELTALFLTEPDARDPRAPGAGPAPIEILLVGHLPVRGGLWLGPYADAIGREQGPVALVRLDMDEPTIEVFRGQADAIGSIAQVSLQRRIAELAGMVGAWIIRPAEKTAASEIVAAGADRLTILTGGDEAAIVGAYRLLKDLTDAGGRAARPDADSPDRPVLVVADEPHAGPLPPIGLAVMGCERAHASAVVERLNRTASTFLGFDLSLAASVPQMDAGMRSSGQQRFADQPRPGIRDVIGWISEARAAAAARPPEPPRRSAARLVASQPPALQPPARASIAAPSAAPVPPIAPAPARPAPVKMPPKPRLDVEPKAPLAPAEPDAAGAPLSLAAHIDGLTPLPVRCPHHESIELAVDHAGRLHVIGWDQSMRELWAVESWAKAHRELIAMACREHWFDPAGKVVRHLVTGRPASVADLHGTDLRLHVLAPVRVNNQTAWYAAPLNADLP